MTVPRYARVEYERRFLVDPDSDWQSGVKRWSRLIEDRYLVCGRLRVRRLSVSDSGRVSLKLTKKFAQPIVSIQLSPEEYETRMSLNGYDICKTRYYEE